MRTTSQAQAVTSSELGPGRRVSPVPDAREDRLVLAPAAVVRAAAWPLESVTGLSIDDDGLEHSDRVERERQRLWKTTAGDPAFMRALSLSNPRLAEHLIELLVNRMSDFHYQVGEMMGQSVEQRLARATGPV